MNLTKDALRLTKKYAGGAPCKVNFNDIEHTMFYPYYLAIAQNTNLKKITPDVVREYWLKIHNRIVVEMFEKRAINVQEAKPHMVRPRKSGDKFFAVHGNKTVDILTPEQAKALEEQIQSAPRSLH